MPNEHITIIKVQDWSKMKYPRSLDRKPRSQRQSATAGTNNGALTGGAQRPISQIHAGVDVHHDSLISPSHSSLAFRLASRGRYSTVIDSRTDGDICNRAVTAIAITVPHTLMS
jgi:hypothetical protein